jgi:hypothetical protein
VVIGVGSGLSAIQVRWRDPFGFASGVGAGGPPLFDESVIGTTRQGQVVDIGAAGGRPSPNVVDLAVVRRCVTARFRAPTILGQGVAARRAER